MAALLCPGCQQPVTGMLALGPPGVPHQRRPPPAGAAALCSSCGEVNVFEAGPLGVILRPASTEELAELARQPQFRTTAAAVLRARAHRR